MKKKLIFGFFFMLILCNYSYASLWDVVKETLNTINTARPAESKIDLGLKEALSVGIKNSITYLARTDGYFANQAVKILLPEEVRKTEKVLRGIGFGPQLDEFTLSMNRAAEKAAPLAADIFSAAITEMSFDDANRILRGGNTAATDYLKNKTYNKLLELFQPAVRQAMNEFNVTQQYDAINTKLQALPLIGKVLNLDVNNYVASKALDGLFYTLGKEETKIRTNPSARVTELLKEVFK
ncbi:MAG TPA: DUF4197 domain-containing protein [Smithellaceae bacterium]|nr:DUF4197 domain-containing protein [Smithellaceae bacterium]HRS89892.1 DUF4197 domain-containing protein [Smithellaceae bacterium]HRV26709.1 DUF4197 domain-containing protein [Smithellaceae bacterium]